MRPYLDTSAVMKLIVEEPESTALATQLEDLPDTDLVVSSWLLHAELRCAAIRRPTEVAASAVQEVLDRLLLVDLTRADLLSAPTAGAGLGSQDAMHLAVALRVRADQMVTYDDEQAAAALRVGMRVRAPR